MPSDVANLSLNEIDEENFKREIQENKSFQFMLRFLSRRQLNLIKLNFLSLLQFFNHSVSKLSLNVNLHSFFLSSLCRSTSNRKRKVNYAWVSHFRHKEQKKN